MTMLFRFILAALAILLGLWLRGRKEYFRFFQKLGILGPKPSVIVGNLHEMFFKNCLWAINDWHRKFGAVVGCFYGTTPVLLVADKDILKEVVEQDSKLRNYHMFSLSPAKFLKTTELEKNSWKTTRNDLVAKFSEFNGMTDAVEQCLEDLMARIARNCHKGNIEFDIAEFFDDLFLDAVCRSFIGFDRKLQKTPDKQLMTALKSKFDQKLFFLRSFQASLPELYKNIDNLLRPMLKKNTDDSKKDCLEALHESCVNELKKRESNPREKIDGLQLIYDVVKTKYQGSDKIANIAGAAGVLTVLSGCEKSSSAMAFIVNMLIRHQDIQGQIRDELRKYTNNGSNISQETISQCRFLDAVIKETLRMYPPIYAQSHGMATETIKCKNGLEIREGTCVVSSIRVLHYNDEYWSNAEAFLPERFLSDEAADRPWFPFGSDPVTCVSVPIILFFIKATLTHILLKYELSTFEYMQQSRKVELEVNPTIVKLRDGLKCRAIPL